jgi:FkbM family methyltransferase
MEGLLNKLLARAGYKYYKIKFQPFGLDHALDVRRFYATSGKVKVVFDVGANEGQSAEHYNETFPDAEIYCFEPVAATFRSLVERTHNMKRVRTFPVALGDVEREVEIELAEQSQLNSLKRRAPKPGNKTIERVQVRTLDSFVAEQGIERIDFLKTDTEGFDLEVLRGAQSTLADGKIQSVLSEATFNRNDTAHSSFFALADYLQCYGFEFVDVYDHAYVSTSPYRPPLGHCNALFYQTRKSEIC